MIIAAYLPLSQANNSREVIWSDGYNKRGLNSILEDEPEDSHERDRIYVLLLLEILDNFKDTFTNCRQHCKMRGEIIQWSA